MTHRNNQERGGGQNLSLRQSLQILPRSLWILSVGSFVNRFGTFVYPFLALYLTRVGYSAAQAGVAITIYGVGSIASSALGGVLADCIGPRATITISMGTSAVTMLALSQAHGLVILTLLAGLAGLTGDLYRPAGKALVAALAPAPHRVAAYALSRFAVNLGVAAGPILAGLLANRAFGLLFLGDAVTSLAFGVLALVALPRGVPYRTTTESSEAGRRGILRDRAFLRLLIACALVGFVYFQAYSTFALQVRANGLSAAVYGALLSLNGLLIIAFELPLTTVTQRLPVRPAIATGLLLIGLGFSVNAIAHTVPLLGLSVLLWTIGEMVHSPVLSAYVAALAPPRLIGRYQGLYGLAWGSGLLLAPAVGTALFSWHPPVLWLLCGALGFVAATLVLIGEATPTSTTGLSQ
ncbi:MAG: MDR family MFS transporter [Thermomicrobiales bacterium]